MKKITICLALTILFFACKKTELPVQPDQEFATASSEKKGGGTSPTVTTTAVSYILSFGATSGGSVSSTGGGMSVQERGVCLNTSPNPTIAHTKFPSGSGPGTFTTIMSGLAGTTTYYARAYATKSTGTTYGNQISFTTANPNYGTVTDIDGNVYTTIQIGSQTWTVENLKTTRYRNGVTIPNVTDNTAWAALSTGAYCNYNNDEANVATYGRLYNWYALTDANNIAPAGWHTPSLAEWDILRNYLGDLNIAGGKAKEAGLAHWVTPNTGADNSSGFTALPAGSRYVNYTTGSCSAATPVHFTHLGYNGVWWTSTNAGSDPNNSWFIETDNTSARFYRSGFLMCFGYYEKKTGYSIRLIKD